MNKLALESKYNERQQMEEMVREMHELVNETFQRTSNVVFDNENYESVEKRIRNENRIKKERLAEMRGVISKNEHMATKWNDIYIESKLHMQASAK